MPCVAVIATSGTVVGLVLLLGYRSEGAVKVDKVVAAPAEQYQP